MPGVDARYIDHLQQYRCGLFDCNALLFRGKIQSALIEIKCKCGAMNKIIVEIAPKPDSQAPVVESTAPYTDRIGLQRKADGKFSKRAK